MPIHKSGDKQLLENYRPISKLCIIAKIFESIIYDYLFNEVKNIINVEQHGFMRGRSVETNLFLYTNYLLEQMNAGFQVDAVYTDFSKAFDKIDHSILIRRLADVGVHGSLLRWIASYVNNRRQSVVIGDCYSAYRKLTSGVPQGSHLGPLLFNLYVNNIVRCFRFARFLMYADDLKIFSVISSFSDSIKLQEDLYRLFQYYQENFLFLNFSKCHFITFSRNKNTINAQYEINNSFLTRVFVVKDLGILYDSKLIFDQHIDYISKKGHKTLGFIIRICKDFRQWQSIRVLYIAYVQSILTFGSVIWNPCYNVYINRLENVQNKLIRYINGKFHQNNVNNKERIMKDLKLLNPTDQRMMRDVKFIYKIINGSDCCELVSMLTFNIPSYNTRNRFLFHIRQSSTNYHLNSPLIRCLKSFNSISGLINVDPFSQSLENFSVTLRRFFLDNV